MSKITRRSYKRKKIVMGLALFGAIGLVSTGFAAWVLSASASNTQNPNIKVGAVSDKSMTFQNVAIYGLNDAGEEVLTSNYSFNPRYNDNTGRVRFGPGEITPEHPAADEGERLSLTVKGEITEAQNLGSLKVSFDAIPTKLQNAVDAGFIKLPSCATEAQDVTYTISGEGSKLASFEYEIAFKWGDAFGGVNPGDYYDQTSGAGHDATVEEIKETLDSLHELDPEQFSVTFVAMPN